jgi:hypothetical protein
MEANERRGNVSTYLQAAAASLPICTWLGNGAYRLDDADGKTVARYIMGDRGIVWSVAYKPYASMSDAFMALERGDLVATRLDKDGQDYLRAIQLDAGGR